MSDFLQWEIWEVWESGRTSRRVAAFSDKAEAEQYRIRYAKAHPRQTIDVLQGKKVKPKTPKPPRQIYGSGR